MLGLSRTSLDGAVHGLQRFLKDEDHGPAHEDHTDQHDHVDNESQKDADSVHHPVLPQVCTESQILDRCLCPEGNVSLCSRGNQQRQSHEHGHHPGKGDQGRGTSAAQGFKAERVTDSHVAFEAKRGHVEDRGVAAGLEQEVVDLTRSVAFCCWEWKPDSAVELHRHADEEHQEVRARQANHVVGDVLLQVAITLQHLSHSDGDRVPHDTRHQDEAVEDCQEDFDGVVGFKLTPVFVYFLIHGYGGVSSDFPGIDSVLIRSAGRNLLPPRTRSELVSKITTYIAGSSFCVK